MDGIQRELREVPGVTVLIYAQTCATEKRRRRKRGLMEDPNRFVVINDLVCEGCGDCSVESNCLSVIPKETPFGRKRQIDQNTCNKDFSCANGFCPSFVTIEGGERRRRNEIASAGFPEDKLESLAAPAIPSLESGYDLLVTGVGGTGVVTVGALITMAAHLEGRGTSVLDFMGFAQKFGPVLSYIRFAASPAELNQVRIDDQQADALIGCDLVVSSSPKASRTYRKGHTRAAINTTEMATADFVKFRDASLHAGERVAAIADIIGQKNLSSVAANRLADALLGDTIFANVFMLGFSWQAGLVPVSSAALLRAIELNGVAVDRNVQAFNWGRIAAADPGFVDALLEQPGAGVSGIESLDDSIARRRDFLVGYQDEALAERYVDLVERVRRTEEAITDGNELVDAVARAYFKTLAYKDEYEVARLYTQTSFLGDMGEAFGDGARLRFHLAPPIAGGATDARGRPRKREFGAWILPLFRLLARMKRLRGTAFDPFGRTAERRMERALIAEFEETIEKLLGELTGSNRQLAAEIVGEYLDIRGFGPVKAAAAQEVRRRIAEKLAGFRAAGRKAA
jgi:indolepyruvate ferredoxin oxidoreductase